MPPRARRPRKPKEDAPTFFGPPPPPPPPRVQIPDSVARPDEGASGETVSLMEGAGEIAERRVRKRKNPRKKLKGGTGWEADYKLPAPHQADTEGAGRYDPSLPYDQRLLRAADEWRSLRALPLDLRINYESMLSLLGLDMYELRLKYGRQRLRGFEPDEDYYESEEDEEGDDGGVVAVEVPKVVELEESTEEQWANETLNMKTIATWLDARANDGYTPTLTAAPQVLGNFLRFLLARNVLPLEAKQIKGVLPIVDLAKLELAPMGSLYKQLPSPFHKALHHLFSDPASTLASPIPDQDRPSAPAQPMISDILTVTSFIDETTDANLEDDTRPLELEGWPTMAEGEAEGGLEAQRHKLEQIKKSLEDEAKGFDLWKPHSEATEDATKKVNAVLRRIGMDVEMEGEWRVGSKERSARQLLGWEKVEPKQSADGKTMDDSTLASRTVVRLHLSPHQDDFPVTTFVKECSSFAHRLDEPISVVVDLPDSTLKHLVKNILFEADLTRLIFVPSDPTILESNPDTHIWMLSAIYRILPSYYRLIGEGLRDEPGRQRDSDASWEAPPTVEKHLQPPGAVSGDGEKAPEANGGLKDKEVEELKSQEGKSLETKEGSAGGEAGSRGKGNRRGRGRRGGGGGLSTPAGEALSSQPPPST